MSGVYPGCAFSRFKLLTDEAYQTWFMWKWDGIFMISSSKMWYFSIVCSNHRVSTKHCLFTKYTIVCQVWTSTSSQWRKVFFLLLNRSCLLQRLLISLSALFGAKVSLYPGLLWFSIFCPISDKCIPWFYRAVSFLARWSCGNVQFMDVTIWTENTVLKARERFDWNKD